MLVKVSLEELNRSNKLAFPLYSASGERIFPTGTVLQGIDYWHLRKTPVYRELDDLPLDHEGILFKPTGPLTEYEREEATLEVATPSIYQPEVEIETLEAVHHFWNQMGLGVAPDVALLEVARDRLVSEVTSKIDEVTFLSQLRVRDYFTYDHTLDVTALSIALAKKLGYDQEAVKEVALAAMLHDLGKLLIPKPIMFKSTRLTETEFEVMKLHPMLGYKMITEQLKLPEHIARPALEHQEMHAGGGYPQNIKGEEIHPYSQIVKVADVYDALTSKRPYKEPIPSSKSLKIMLSEGSKSFHPDALRAFLEMSHYPMDDLPPDALAS